MSQIQFFTSFLCLPVSGITANLDGPKFMAEDAKLYNYPFPYLYDETQDVARFGAVCTPEFFLFKKARLPNLNQVGNCKQVLCRATKEIYDLSLCDPLRRLWD